MDDPTIRSILEHARAHGAFRGRDLVGIQNPWPQLARLVARGELHKIGRGTYALPGYEESHDAMLLRAYARVPRGVFSLSSALYVQGYLRKPPGEIYTTVPQNPQHAIKVTDGIFFSVPHKSRIAIGDLPIKLLRRSGEGYRCGIETVPFCGKLVRAYSPRKTLADFLKYADKVNQNWLPLMIQLRRDVVDVSQKAALEYIAFLVINRVVGLGRELEECFKMLTVPTTPEKGTGRR